MFELFPCVKQGKISRQTNPTNKILENQLTNKNEKQKNNQNGLTYKYDIQNHKKV